MDWIGILVAVGITLLGAGSVVLVALGLPGTWALLAVALLVELVDGLYLSTEPPTTFSWWLLGVCVGLAALAELLELLAGAAGAKRGGSSRRGVVGSVIGGVVGAIVGAPFGLVIGSLAGALLGTFAGAILGELTNPGPRPGGLMRPASGAVVGRLLGTLAKVPLATAVWIALSVAAFV